MDTARLAAVIATIALGCSGSPGSRSVSGPPAVASAYPATRWVPDKATYVVAARTVTDAQTSLRELIDLLGMVGGYELGEASHDLEGLFGVDVLGGDAVAGIGVDLRGGWAMFSDDINPTFVVHLTAPEQMTAFLERQRDRGLVTQSVIVDKVEVFTAKVGGVPLSWAIAGDWMWLHVQLPIGHDDGTSWFLASHGARGASWSGTWSWAHGIAGDAPVLGFIDLRGIASSVSARVPAAAACLQLVEPVARAGVAVETDGHRFGVKLAFDVGSTAGVSRMLLPAPGGWAAQAQSSALAAAWNLDLFAARAWLSPCLRTIGSEIAELDAVGVRTGRVLLQSFDADAKAGTGAVALDLTRADYLTHKLDDIPLRSTLERDRTFGPYQGHSISIPFSVTVDYVLTGKLALAAVGEGLLAKIAAGAPAPRSDVFAIDLAPPRLSTGAWAALLDFADLPHAKRVAERLARWHDIHVGLATEPTQLVFSIAATHR